MTRLLPTARIDLPERTPFPAGVDAASLDLVADHRVGPLANRARFRRGRTPGTWRLRFTVQGRTGFLCTVRLAATADGHGFTGTARAWLTGAWIWCFIGPGLVLLMVGTVGLLDRVWPAVGVCLPGGLRAASAGPGGVRHPGPQPAPAARRSSSARSRSLDVSSAA